MTGFLKPPKPMSLSQAERMVEQARLRYSAGEVLSRREIAELAQYVSTGEVFAWRERLKHVEDKAAAAIVHDHKAFLRYKRQLHRTGREQRADKPRRVRA